MLDKMDKPKQIRNKKLVPCLEKEGILTKDIILAIKDKHEPADVGLRLYSHHTLASVRVMSYYHPFDIPQDSLDYSLTSTYNHTSETFPDKVDVYLQPETIGCETWRKIRNTRDPRASSITKSEHVIKFGGITERLSPHSVKLMNSGVHSSQTNPGFSRKPAGGAIFFY